MADSFTVRVDRHPHAQPRSTVHISRAAKKRVETNRHHQTVCLAWLSPGHVHHRFATSIGLLMLYDADHGRYLIDGGLIGLETSPRIAAARCQVVEHFLNMPEKHDWLLFVDSDMIFTETLIIDMMAVIDSKPEVKVLGGLCFGGGHGEAVFPTLYVLVEKDPIRLERVMNYPEDSLVQVTATGAACILIHRRVLVEMYEKYKDLDDGTPNPYPWFKDATSGGHPIGEDIWFCMQAATLGYPTYVHTGIKLGHMKEANINESHYVKDRDKHIKRYGTAEALVVE